MSLSVLQETLILSLTSWIFRGTSWVNWLDLRDRKDIIQMVKYSVIANWMRKLASFTQSVSLNFTLHVSKLTFAEWGSIRNKCKISYQHFYINWKPFVPNKVFTLFRKYSGKFSNIGLQILFYSNLFLFKTHLFGVKIVCLKRWN